MGYDAWLEKPYQDAYANEEAFEYAAEEYNRMGFYEEHLTEWLEENPGKTEDDFIVCDEYTSAVERYLEQISRPDYD